MKKNIVQDVVPPKKTIRNVELPSRSKKSIPTVLDVKPKSQAGAKKITPQKASLVKEEEKVTSVRKSTFEYPESDNDNKTGYMKYFISGVVLVSLIFLVSSFFKSAEITFTPKQETRVLNEVFSAEKNIASGGLGYQIVTTAKELEKTVPATGEEKVEKKSSGTIIIYNTTTESQRLVATTRFETTSGLIYRAKTAVTIPARQTKDGKTVAGMAEVIVEADQPGEKYNIPLSDFGIVGFKGTSKYTQIYARGKTIMSGGFVGVEKTISKEVLDKAGAELEQSLKDQLSLDIVSQIPNNFVLYKTSLSFDFEPLVQTNSSSASAVVKKRGVVSAIIFDRTAISNSILQKILPNTEQGSVKISNLDSLNFTLNTTAFDPNNTNTISFSIKGDANIVWVFDEDKMRVDLLGLSKKNAEDVMSRYVNMKEVWIKTKPFWSKKIPSNPEKVYIVNTIEK